VIAAISRAIQLQSQYNIRVLNLSLGRGIYESYTLDPLCQAVEQAWNAGIVVVVAAGNAGRDTSLNTNGYATITVPGNDPYVITVGAMNANDNRRVNDVIASYSSKGPSLIDHIAKPDLVAPGNQVVSLLATNSTLVQLNPGNDVFPCASAGSLCGPQYGNAQYFKLSGTSMAAPLVSGAAALMIQKDPTLTPDMVKGRLMKSAYKGFRAYSTVFDWRGRAYNNQGDLFTYGAGYLDVAAALNNTDTGVGYALSPTAVYNASNNTVTLIATTPNGSSVTWGTSILWGSSVLWGDSVVWGSNVLVNSSSVLWGNSILWGSSVVWGDNTTAGFSVLWGNSVLWGDSAMQALSDDDPGDCQLDPLTGTVTCSQ